MFWIAWAINHTAGRLGVWRSQMQSRLPCLTERAFDITRSTVIILGAAIVAITYIQSEHGKRALQQALHKVRE
jgi:hypothetical protein